MFLNYFFMKIVIQKLYRKHHAIPIELRNKKQINVMVLTIF